MCSLIEMAVARKYAIKGAEANSEQIHDHVLKCLIYENSTNSLLHWKQEIVSFLIDVNNLNVKSGNGKLRSKDYYKALFENYGDTELDLRAQMGIFRGLNYKKYPYFNTEDIDVHKKFEIYQNFVNEACKILSDNKTTNKDILSMVDNTLQFERNPK